MVLLVSIRLGIRIVASSGGEGANGFQGGSSCHMGAVLTPSIVAASLTYTGICEFEREVMQRCHYVLSNAATCNFRLYHWHTEK